MSKKYKESNPWFLKFILQYLIKQADKLEKPLHKKFVKENIKAIAYYFGLYHYWRQI